MITRINMSDPKQDPMLEETDLIEVNEGHIGTFNKAVYAVISIICLLYLILHIRP